LKSEVSQNVDTWSLGCVLSLAATWIVFGYQGIHQYERLRADAFRKVLKAARRSSGPDPNVKPNHPLAQFSKANIEQEYDYFHDGERVLPEVTQWHAVLSVSVRTNDSLTPKILDVIDKQMLRTDGLPPSTATEVWRELDRLLKTHKPISMPKDTGSVVDTLIKLDSKLPLTVENRRTSYSSSTDTRQERKVKRLSVQPSLMRTTHRSEHLGFEQSGNLGSSQLKAMRDSKKPAELPADSPLSTWRSHEGNDKASHYQHHRPSLAAIRVVKSSDSVPSPKPPQNVINAYLRNKRNRFKGKDPSLEKYFAQGDRDIVCIHR
jgi:hypothetical protein